MNVEEYENMDLEKEFGVTLRDAIKEYLERNHWSIGYMSDITKISRTSLATWLRGERELNVEKIQNIYRFLAGGHVVTAADVIGHQMLLKELEEKEVLQQMETHILELTPNEKRCLIDILREKHDTTERIMLAITLKSILKKLGVELEDGLPAYEDLIKTSENSSSKPVDK